MNDLERLAEHYGNLAKYLAETAKEFANSQNDELMLQAARYENASKEYGLIAEALIALREKKEREQKGKL